jgi:hypothetical protein
MQLPHPALRFLQKNEQTLVWDIARRKWVQFTPEEHVRQAVIHYFSNQLGIPLSWMAVEKQITLFGRKKRFDLLVYESGDKPWLMVECKAPKVAITAATFDQVARYNLAFQVPYLVVTNGEELFCAKIDTENKLITWIETIPAPPKN